MTPSAVRIANQLLAAIALTVCTTLLIKHGKLKWAWVTGIPLAWDATVTLTASWQKVFSDSPTLGFFAQRARYQEALWANLEVLVPLLARHGWLGSHLVGADGAHACWQLVRHAPPPYRRRYLPLLARAVARGHASAADLAHLHDRVSVDRRRPKAFGTQSLALPGSPRRLWPTEHGVNIRRAAAGLPGLSAAELAAIWAPGDLRRLGIITRARCC